VVSAVVAGVCGTVADAMVFAVEFAGLAEGNSIGIPLGGNVLKAGSIVRKLVIEVEDGVAKFFWNMLFHATV
jgi:hypothetical protein